jgi:glutamine amidotransferase
MEAVRRTGLDDVAAAAVEAGTPFLGICVGLQLLYERSEEAPGVAGLGLLEGTVRRLPDGVKRPQMQWNILEPVRPSALLDGLASPAWVYFVHSFSPDDPANAVATCDYGGPVVAAVERGPIWATQFHPEKSGANGLRMLANFVERVRAGRVPAAAS